MSATIARWLSKRQLTRSMYFGMLWSLVAKVNVTYCRIWAERHSLEEPIAEVGTLLVCFEGAGSLDVDSKSAT